MRESSKRRVHVACASLAVACASWAAGATLPRFSTDAEAERFLRSAKVIEIKPLGMGVTYSKVATLSDGTTTAKAVWKVIDEFAPVRRFHDGGPPELGFRDTYKSEIAAYKLDRLIGLGQVPPTVERRLRRNKGSLQLWIDDCMTEGERRREGIEPPDVGRWKWQMRRATVFFQLIRDVDHVNLSNLLIDPDFTLHTVDSSRAFRTQVALLDPEQPDRYSRTLLDGLSRLDEQTLRRELGKWLSDKQRRSVLERRDKILERAARLVALHGEDQILDP